MISDFNLIVSCPRDYERHCESELWFNLNALGDSTPIIAVAGVPGLLVVKTAIDARKFIQFLRDLMLHRDNDYVQFISKIYPIDRVVEADLDLIEQAAIELLQKNPSSQNPESKFRISVRKRQSELRTDEIIPRLAERISNPVSLKEYDWMLQIEIINKYCGLSIITDEEIFQPIRELRIAGLEREIQLPDE
jgi:tRNA acetyltransferase TAN1